MPGLADIQAAIREALVTGNAATAVPLLAGGTRPDRRLAIHQRHYAASLTRALVERFPATVWLVGSDLVTDAAVSFVREQPPSKPCIAEYGDTFPRHLGMHPGAASLPYLAQFATLEWHVGRLALATDDSTRVERLRMDWALDELLSLYLTDSAPDQFPLRQEHVWLEISGVRGEIHMRRMTANEHASETATRPTGERG